MVSEHSSTASNIENCEDGKAGRKRPSATCLHCDFRSDSPTVLTQHLWDKHPLRMRRKQHLFKTNSTYEKSTTKNKTKESVCADVKPVDIPSKDAQVKSTTTIHQHELKHQTLEQPDKEEQTSPPQHQEFLRKQLEIYSQLNAANATMFNNNCAVVIPGQFISIPIATASGLIQQVTVPLHANQYSMDAYLANALSLQMRQNKMNSTAANLSRDVTMSKVQRTASSSENVRYYQQQQQTAVSNTGPIFNDSSTRQKEHNTNVKYLTKKLLSNAVCKSKKQQQAINDSQTEHWQYRNTTARQKPNSPRKSDTESSKKKKSSPVNIKSSSKSSLIDNERMVALEEALRSVCFYDVNDTSSVMPFKCPDNIWRMVRFKCIRGVWLVQLPDSDNPTLYVPFQKPGQHQASLRESIQKALNSKNNNPLFKLFKNEKDETIECPMIHPGTSNTKRPVDMFTNVEKSEVKAKRIQNSVRSGNVLRSLLAGNYQCTNKLRCKAAYDKKLMTQNFPVMSPYSNAMCDKNMVDATKAY